MKVPASLLKLLVVDESVVVRQASELLLRGRPVHVVTAADPVIAVEEMRASRPDVVLLGLSMARVDALSFLRRIMATDPLPVVVWFDPSQSQAALAAVEAGAAEVFAKPSVGIGQYLHEYADRLWARIQAAAQGSEELARALHTDFRREDAGRPQDWAPGR
jgi:two-component system chemotaxis response regulator CheB